MFQTGGYLNLNLFQTGGYLNLNLFQTGGYFGLILFQTGGYCFLGVATIIHFIRRLTPASYYAIPSGF